MMNESGQNTLLLFFRSSFIVHHSSFIMAVIKTPQPSPVLTPFTIHDMETQAQALLARARRGAELLLREAQKQGEELRSAARAEGFALGKKEGVVAGQEQGRIEGHEAALAEIRPKLALTWDALTAAVNQLEASRHDLEAGGINEVVNLAAAIARRVTKLQASIDPNVLTENLKEAMKIAVHVSDVHIVIHPAQKQMLETELPRLKLHWPQVKHVTLMEDESVGMGGCRIMTRHGEVDASIDEQLDRVISELTMGA
jgi:flagellar assembly protein FliH